MSAGTSPLKKRMGFILSLRTTSATMAGDENAAVLFVYTGVGEGAVVPKDVVRVRIDPSVLAIPANAFARRYKLKEVKLHDGLLEIGPRAFEYCTALNDIVIPSGLREIGYAAFNLCTALKQVHVSDGVESIGQFAFNRCRFTKFRSPPLSLPQSLRV